MKMNLVNCSNYSKLILALLISISSSENILATQIKSSRCSLQNQDTLFEFKAGLLLQTMNQINLNNNLSIFQDHIVFTPQLQISPVIQIKKKLSLHFGYAFGYFKQELDLSQYGLVDYNHPNIFGVLVQQSGVFSTKSFGLSYLIGQSNKVHLEILGSFGYISFNQSSVKIKTFSSSGTSINNNLIGVKDKFNNPISCVGFQFHYLINKVLTLNVSSALCHIIRKRSGMSLEFPIYNLVFLRHSLGVTFNVREK